MIGWCNEMTSMSKDATVAEVEANASAPAGVSSSRKGAKGGKRNKHDASEVSKDRKIASNGSLAPWLFLLPAMVVVIVFFIIPFFNTLRLSFTNATLLNPGHFIGLDNFRKMFEDDHVKTALLNSSLYVVCIVPCMVFFPLILAALVSGKGKIMGFFRTSFYMPVVVSTVIVGLIWTNLLDDRGLINSIFKSFHWITKSIPFLTDRWLLLFSAMIVTIWTGLGYYMVIYLSALANVDPSLYEAAELDGCGPISRFFHVTMPGVRSTMVLIMLLSSIAAFRVFNEVYVLTGGTAGVGGQDMTMSILIKREGTGLQARTGYTGAISMLMFVILGTLIAIEYIIQRKADKDA